MQVSIYVRVSTGSQEVENQLIQLRKYCQKLDYNIYKEYVDVMSGKEKSRPAYDQLFKDAHRGLFDMVLFWDLSRFSRAGTLHTLQKLQELEGMNIKWHSYNDAYLSSAGQFKDVVISIIATLAKIEREKISKRTKAGLERARQQGKVVGRPKVSKYIVQKVLTLYDELKSIRAVSKKVNISYGSVHNIIKNRGEENRAANTSNIDISENGRFMTKEQNENT